MPFTYWNDATEHIHALSRISADVWGCDPYTHTPNGRRVPLAADFSPRFPIVWHPHAPLYAVRVADISFLSELHTVPAHVTTAPSQPEQCRVTMPLVGALQAADALARNTRFPDLKGVRGICARVQHHEPSGDYIAQLTGDGVPIGQSWNATEEQAHAVQTAWMRWAEVQWFEIRDAAERHGWGAVTKWAFKVL